MVTAAFISDARFCSRCISLPGTAGDSLIGGHMSDFYQNEIVISLNRASVLEFRLTKQFFSVLPQRVRLIWNGGAHVQTLLQLLVDYNLDIGLLAKGRGCWTTFGYMLARSHSRVIALHECDITSYNREYMAHLCYPIVKSNLGYELRKGYSSRVTDRLHAQVTQAVPDIFDGLFEAVEADHVWNPTAEPAAALS